ncbi:MAG: peptidase [Herminiimonas sp.]|nr:peptidase [Herminiimonas sp.]MDB5854238.1 peptidase [Herminiimonas sp.]
MRSSSLHFGTHAFRASGTKALSAKLIISFGTVAALSGSLILSANAAPPFANSNDDFAATRILVEPRAGLSTASLTTILSPHGGKAHKVGQSNLYIVELPANASPRAVVAQLSGHPHIKTAELDRRVKSSFAPTDPYFGSEWHLPKVGASSAWDTSQGAGVTIAILDSGVDGAHPDLTPNLVAGYNFYSNNSDTSDACGHGTAVAGVAAAAINNGAGVAGVAGKSKVMPIRVAYFDPTRNGCYAFYSTIVSGLTYAADHGARVANVSYGGMAASSTVQSAAQYMKGKGGLVFVSAGNDGVDANVAATSTMIPVSATDSNDSVASWSTYGAFVALSAPGAGIWTTSQGGNYQAWTGTSFSSPLTAGVAALMMAANPALDGTKIESLMYASAVDLGAAGRDPYYGYGRVDAAAGVKAAVATVSTIDTQAPTSSISAPVAFSSVTGLVAVNVSAADNVGVARVELQVNGNTVASDSSAPFGFSWDSTGVANGMANLVAVAYDAAGNAAPSPAVSVNVANATTVLRVADTTPPVVAIANPVAGMVNGTVSVSLNASDNGGAAGITQQLFIDGVLKAKGTGGTLGYNWNTRKVANGIHTLKAVAIDAAGNSSSASVQVTK